MPEPTVVQVLPEVLDEMVAHCLDAFPEEGCGLVAAVPGSGMITRCYPARNASASARVYEIDSRDYLRADLDAESGGLEIVGAFHSHTHTDAYPSPTDIAQAQDPNWHYLVISLRHEVPSTRSYRIAEGQVVEEPLQLTTWSGGDDPQNPTEVVNN